MKQFKDVAQVVMAAIAIIGYAIGLILTLQNMAAEASVNAAIPNSGHAIILCFAIAAGAGVVAVILSEKGDTK